MFCVSPVTRSVTESEFFKFAVGSGSVYQDDRFSGALPTPFLPTPQRVCNGCATAIFGVGYINGGQPVKSTTRAARRATKRCLHSQRGGVEAVYCRNAVEL